MNTTYLQEKLAQTIAQLDKGERLIWAAREAGDLALVERYEERWCERLAQYESIYDAIHAND